MLLQEAGFVCDCACSPLAWTEYSDQLYSSLWGLVAQEFSFSIKKEGTLADAKNKLVKN